MQKLPVTRYCSFHCIQQMIVLGLLKQWYIGTALCAIQRRKNFNFNPLKTKPEFTQAGIYGKCVL